MAQIPGNIIKNIIKNGLHQRVSATSSAKKWRIYLKLQRNGTEKGLPNLKDTFTERFQLQLLVLHQSMCISKAGPSSLRHVMTKHKDKVPDISDFTRGYGSPNLALQ